MIINDSKRKKHKQSRLANNCFLFKNLIIVDVSGDTAIEAKDENKTEESIGDTVKLFFCEYVD